MGMPIKEAIPILHDMYNYYNDVDVDDYAGFDKEDNDAIETALGIMHKYQKIAQIIRNYDVAWEFHHMKPTIDEIRKVVEDGKSD